MSSKLAVTGNRTLNILARNKIHLLLLLLQNKYMAINSNNYISIYNVYIN